MIGLGFGKGSGNVIQEGKDGVYLANGSTHGRCCNLDVGVLWNLLMELPARANVGSKLVRIHHCGNMETVKVSAVQGSPSVEEQSSLR